jgi:hypothetical protein
MNIYIDSEFKCHTTNPDGIYTEVETDFFNSKCATFIEGHRFVPVGETWIREDGKVFRGKMITSWKNYNELDTAKREYERQLLAEYAEALRTMGVKV